MIPPLRILTNAASLEPLGGVEMCTLQDTLALAERGHHVDLLHGADGSLRPTYESAGVGLAGPFPFAFSPRRALRDLAGYLPAARWARRQRPDVLWLNRAEHLVWGQTVARAAGCALVCHLHGPPVYQRVRAVGLGVAHYVAVSEFVRQAYLDRGVPAHRISLLYNAISTAQYPEGGLVERKQARMRLGLPDDAPLVLCYGQMTPEKGVGLLLEAWRVLSAQRKDAVLVLLDSSSTGPNTWLERELARLDPATYRAFPITRDVVPFLHACDVVAFPSLLPEAFGRVAVEGMATGRPVVASRVGAVPEILSGPMARFLVEPGSVEELATRLTGLLDWRRDEPGLGDECAEWVARRFPFEAHVDGLERILQRQALSSVER
jgi:glycosyltransferase involved in cell wall biosynthesis